MYRGEKYHNRLAVWMMTWVVLIGLMVIFQRAWLGVFAIPMVVWFCFITRYWRER